MLGEAFFKKETFQYKEERATGPMTDATLNKGDETLSMTCQPGYGSDLEPRLLFPSTLLALYAITFRSTRSSVKLAEGISQNKGQMLNWSWSTDAWSELTFVDTAETAVSEAKASHRRTPWPLHAASVS